MLLFRLTLVGPPRSPETSFCNGPRPNICDMGMAQGRLGDSCCMPFSCYFLQFLVVTTKLYYNLANGSSLEETEKQSSQ